MFCWKITNCWLTLFTGSWAIVIIIIRNTTRLHLLKSIIYQVSTLVYLCDQAIRKQNVMFVYRIDWLTIMAFCFLEKLFDTQQWVFVLRVNAGYGCSYKIYKKLIKIKIYKHDWFMSLNWCGCRYGLCTTTINGVWARVVSFK